MIFSIWYCILFNYWIFIWCNRTRFSINYEPTALQKSLPLVSIVRFDLHSKTNNKKTLANGTQMKTKPKITCKTLQLKWRRMIAFIVARNAIFPDGQEDGVQPIRGFSWRTFSTCERIEDLTWKRWKESKWKWLRREAHSWQCSKWESSVGKYQSLCIPFDSFGWVRMCLCTKYTIRCGTKKRLRKTMWYENR